MMRLSSWRRSCGGAGLAGGIWLAASSACAEPAHIFRLPAEPVDRALVRFGIQAGVSVGGFPAPGCVGTSRPVIGVLTTSAALRRLLPPGCAFDRIDRAAYQVRGVRPAAPVQPSAAPMSAVGLEEVIVTAEKRREPLRGSPFAVTVLTATDIRRVGAKSFADAALQFPGVAETNLGPGRDKIFIRGISDGAFTGRTQSTVGLYLDNVPITYNAPDPDLRLADVERVEVLRGPQGTLYGSGSIGGIVRVVTARADPRGFEANLSVEGMYNAHSDKSFGGEAMVNLPLLGGHAAVRGVVYKDQLAGYLDNPGLGLKDVNQGHRSGGRVAGLMDLPSGWQAKVTYATQSIATADSQYVQGGAGRLSRDAAIREPHDNNFTLVGAALDHSGSMIDFRLSAAYIDHDLSTRYDATGAFDLAPSQVAAFDETQRVDLWVAEAVVTSASENRLRWLAGVTGSVTHEGSGGALDATLSGGATRSVYRRRDRLTEGALFGELTLDITPQLTATLGGRLFASRSETTSGQFDLARPALAELNGDFTDRGFAPKARLSYAVTPGLVAYAQIQDGYRSGGFNVPAAADGVASGPVVPTYRPDRLRSYEVGGEATLFDGRLTLRSALFRAIWHDVQTDQFRASGLPVTLNIGDGSNTGLEVEAVWRPGNWLIRLNALVDGPELTRTNSEFPARVDIGLPGVAKETGSVDVSYSWDLPFGLKAELAAQAAYVGRSYLTFDGGAATAMGDYGQGRVSATVQGRDWRAQAYVDNVTDEAGNTFAFGNPFSGGRSRQATPLPPRTFGLVVSHSFR